MVPNTGTIYSYFGNLKAVNASHKVIPLCPYFGCCVFTAFAAFFWVAGRTVMTLLYESKSQMILKRRATITQCGKPHVGGCGRLTGLAVAA